MSRKSELLYRRCLGVFILVCALGSLALLACVFFVPVQVAIPEINIPVVAQKTVTPEKPDARAALLLSVKMSRTHAAPVIVAAAKPAAPELNTLVRLVGVLTYGDPKENEALIEILKTKQTRSFHVGDTIPEINATITKIDTAVTVEYNGKQTRLEVRSDDRSELKPITNNRQGAL